MPDISKIQPSRTTSTADASAPAAAIPADPKIRSNATQPVAKDDGVGRPSARELAAAGNPAVLGPDHAPLFGRHKVACADVNLDTGGRWRLKEWEHYAVCTPELIMSFAMVDLKYAKVSWCSVADRATGERFEQSFFTPFAKMAVARELFDAKSVAKSGKYEIEIHNHLDAGRHDVRISLPGSKDKPAVQATLSFAANGIEPCVVTLPVGGGRAMYSHKVPLPAQGTVRVGDREYTVDPKNATGILDVHKGHYPYKTAWKWATGAMRDDQGRLIGFNLTRNMNPDDRTLNENAIWVDGKVHFLDRAVFEQPAGLEGPWRLRSEDGAIDLTFTPEGVRSDYTNALVISSSYHQPYGTFRGTLKIDGETIRVTDMPGVTEDKSSRW